MLGLVEVMKMISAIFGGTVAVGTMILWIIKPIRKKILKWLSKERDQEKKIEELEQGQKVHNQIIEDLSKIKSTITGMKDCFSLEMKEMEERLSTKMDKQVSDINKSIEAQEGHLRQNDYCTVLSLRYQILNLCRLADKYKGLVYSDKTLLYELYHQYADNMKQNHYISDEFNRANKFPEIAKYEENDK